MGIAPDRPEFPLPDDEPARLLALRELGLLDTVSTTVWGGLRAAGADPAAVQGWGRLFQWA